jgi:hypothetical protein
MTLGRTIAIWELEMEYVWVFSTSYNADIMA